MTQNKNLKTRIRERMSLTGETYTTARKYIAATSLPFFEAHLYPKLKDILVDETVIPKVMDRILSPGITLISSQTGGGKTTFAIIAANETDRKTAFIRSVDEKVENHIENPEKVTFFDVDEENTYNFEILNQYDLIIWDELRSLDEYKAKVLKELSKTKPVLATIHATNKDSAINRIFSISTHYSSTSLGCFDHELVGSISGIIHLDRYRNIIPGINKTFCEVSEINQNVFNSAKVKAYNDIRKAIDKNLDLRFRTNTEEAAMKEMLDSLNKGLGEPKNRLQDEIQILIEKGIVKEETKQVSYYRMA